MAVIVPTRRVERQLARDGYGVVLGADEVGVASAAGPVVAAAVAMPLHRRPISGVRDSKTLSARQRDRLCQQILRRATAVGIGAASVAEIERLNIYHATVLAMRRAIRRAGQHDFVIVDGLRITGFEQHVGPYRAIVDGDALCYVVSCASIVAKVTRDRLMNRLAVRYPAFGWERNAGYATPHHRLALAETGVTPHHRRTFITVRRVEHGEQLNGHQQRCAGARGSSIGAGGRCASGARHASAAGESLISPRRQAVVHGRACHQQAARRPPGRD
jgi:ribonuclease HII